MELFFKAIMKSTTKSVILLVCSIISLIVSASGCCSVPGVKGKVVDENNNGIGGAFVIYGYEGTVYKLVDSDTYCRPGTIIRTDENGIFKIPRTTHFHAPLIKGGLSLEIYVVYDPKTHCAGIPPYAIWYKNVPLSVFKKDMWWLAYKKENHLETLTFHNVTNNPIEWYNSLKQLHTPIEKYGWNSWNAPEKDKRAFLSHLLREYEDFQMQYGQKECLYRQFFIKNQFPMSYEEYMEGKPYRTYEEYREAKDSIYKDKTWNDVLSRDKAILVGPLGYTNKLFGEPDYWRRR